MGIIKIDVNGNDVLSAVNFHLEEGVPLENITSRMVYETMNRPGNPAAISEHLRQIKAQMARVAAIDVEVTETDMEALRSLVASIVDRHTSRERAENMAVARAVADVRREYEDALEMKDDIINELEHQVFSLEGECGMLSLTDNAKDFQLAQYEGRVELLLGTIALLTLTMPALADGLPLALNLPTEHLSVLQTLRVARIGPQMTAEMAAEAYAATGYPFKGI